MTLISNEENPDVIINLDKVTSITRQEFGSNFYNISFYYSAENYLYWKFKDEKKRDDIFNMIKQRYSEKV